jgi:hypothetical protein
MAAMLKPVAQGALADEARVARFFFSDVLSSGYGQDVDTLGPLEAVVPWPCKIVTRKNLEYGHPDGHISWTIVVAHGTELSRDGWWHIRHRMMDVLRVTNPVGVESIELAERDNEAERLAVWEKEKKQWNTAEMGSFDNVRLCLAKWAKRQRREEDEPLSLSLKGC